jgi:hypothetical protein
MMDWTSIGLYAEMQQRLTRSPLLVTQSGLAQRLRGEEHQAAEYRAARGDPLREESAPTETAGKSLCFVNTAYWP